jgi:hypothetical protein
MVWIGSEEGVNMVRSLIFSAACVPLLFFYGAPFPKRRYVSEQEVG